MKPPFAGAHAILRASWTCGQISGNSVDSRVPPYLLEGVEPGVLAVWVSRSSSILASPA